MSFDYNRVLIIGATSDDGKALAERVVVSDIPLVISGRRKENLEEFIRQHGNAEVTSKSFDVTKLDEVRNTWRLEKDPAFLAENPEIDCIFVNSGIQRLFNFSKPETVELNIFDQELVTNYTVPVHLTKAFLPHLQAQKKSTALAFTTSQMAIVPMLRCPNDDASKGDLQRFILALRTRLEEGPGHVKVLEIYPPAVQTELHDPKNQPDLKNGHLIGMPLKGFIDEG
ncbi:hypothetical protein N7517_010097 [Penicillium concentricum]|uniref:Short-chain dehydrogenase/reductase SDR n=1 Tax=Penicillium concentricum TaxID=293559 RepID=A0A9W9RIY6_9EURO|nr:uncharacterized protein N7517_010097 [Penicillium concentricum]KAJ5360906.1 hypothetical protein N7517_010097 [Penicillium concentricum]